MQQKLLEEYGQRLCSVVKRTDWQSVLLLAESLRHVWQIDGTVFLCGNGGSAANASHFANDLLYGVAKQGRGVRVNALGTNEAVVTCLANDVSYEDVYAKQLNVLGNKGDLLIVFSGSGNSQNVIRAIETARAIGMKTAALLGYAGGQCLALVDIAVHFDIADMQIAEDMQQIAGHMIMRLLCEFPRVGNIYG